MAFKDQDDKKEKQFVFTTKVVNDIKERFDLGYVIPRHEKFWLAGMPQVKKAGVTFNYTDEELIEYARCAQDIHYFSEKYCKIKREDGSVGEMKLRDYQKDILDLYTNNRFSILMASRQIGKTVSAAITILHYCIFNNDKTIMIVANKADTVIEIVDKIKSIYYLLPYFLKPGVANWNQKTITFDTGCRIRTSAATKSAAIGFTVDFLFLDEFAHIQRNIIDDYYRSVFPTVSAVKNSKIIITSTPNGYNLFYKILTGAEKPIGDKEKNNYASMRVYWWQVPGRYVTFIRLDSHICDKFNIKSAEVLQYIRDLGFQAELLLDQQNQRYEIHIPNREKDLPNFMKAEIAGREGENVISDFFRALTFERQTVKQETGETGLESFRFIEFSDVSSWKEDAIKDIGGEDKFNQEYDLQFSDSNKAIFDSQTLDKLSNAKCTFKHQQIPLLDERTFIKYDDLTWLEGKPEIFDISQVQNYQIVLGVDLSEGLGGDYSIINIFRLLPKPESEWGVNIEGIYDLFKLEQVGLYRSNMRSVPEIAEILYLLCYEFFDQNKLGVVVEMNAFGGELLQKMKDMYGGRNSYSTHVFFRYKHRIDAPKKDIGIKLRQNKNLFVKEYQKRIKCGDIIVHEEGTIYEMTTFIKKETHSGNAVFEADSGHDDVVMTIVELSTVFESLQYQDMVGRLISDLPGHIREKIEKRVGDAPNLKGVDYSILFRAQRAAAAVSPFGIPAPKTSNPFGGGGLSSNPFGNGTGLSNGNPFGNGGGGTYTGNPFGK